MPPLQHGGGYETDWTNLGAANEILNNAIAAGETERAWWFRGPLRPEAASDGGAWAWTAG